MSIWCFEQMSGAVSNEKTMTQGWKTLDLRTLFFFFLKYSVEFQTYEYKCTPYEYSVCTYTQSCSVMDIHFIQDAHTGKLHF